GRRHTRFSRGWSSDVCSSDLFGFARPLWLALLLLAAAGAADNVSAVLRSTMLFALTPDHLRGRLIGIEFAQVASTPALGNLEAGDRKSTRLNSSHVKISYAVF